MKASDKGLQHRGMEAASKLQASRMWNGRMVALSKLEVVWALCSQSRAVAAMRKPDN